jgi:beta-glucosidase
MGLFDQPYVDPAIAKECVRGGGHVKLARRVAQESVTLLKNSNNILPLSKGLRRIAVIGPNADNVYNMLGDYTAPQEDGSVVPFSKVLSQTLALPAFNMSRDAPFGILTLLK